MESTRDHKTDDLLISSIDRLLERLWPFQIEDSRVSQVVQDLRWLKADVSQSLVTVSVPWQIWFFRVVHEPAPRYIEEARPICEKLMVLFHSDSRKDSTDKYAFRLYVDGNTTTSQRALKNLRVLCKMLNDRATCEVIDISHDAQPAAADNIIVTPTLVRTHPTPVRRIIGDLSDLKTAHLLFRTEIEPVVGL